MPSLSEESTPASKMLTSRRSLLKASAAGAALAPVLAACGGSDSGSGGGAEGEPQRGGRLKIGVAGGGANDTLDAHDPTDNVDIARNFALYAALMRYDNDGTIEPYLAESLEPNEDATEWTLVLKEGLTFHDDSPVDSEAVVYSLKRILDPDDPQRGKGDMPGVDPEKLEIVDERTVIIHVDEPLVTLPEALAEYYNCVVPVDYDPENPIGCGPFKFAEFRVGEYSVFERHEGFHMEGLPYVDELEIIDFPDDDARVNALNSGNVHVISQVPHTQVAIIEGDPNMTIMESETGMWLPFTMNVEEKPFDDVRVRQAFRLIVDRQQMVDQALAGYGQIGNDMYARMDPSYPEDFDQREQDIAEAKRLLADAGHENGLDVELVTSDISAGVVAAAEVFQEQAREAGVNVTLRRVNPSDYWNPEEGFPYPFGQDFWSARNYITQTTQGSVVGAPYNETMWGEHEEWLEYLEKARSTPDEDERNELIRKAQEIEYEEGGYIVWGFVNLLDAHSVRVHGLSPAVSGHPLGSYAFHTMWMEQD
ncbi:MULTISPECIES: ABC transporter substrate-binding protein [Nocardiopsis]|uniref:ABC transporter substrate-binding protein n=2 Tax=Nocardiopsis alba TaxID=53437 RepID=A0ABV5DUM4_9ACTN|nr:MULTISPECIES: ABC transporter substrate-binding protein [Nocardiopsis]AFR10107.1 bacterial extracellular solute-binding s, 5 Middle family protein [Nocardiopsis alba ATCC BAA-2165]MEC3895881.1 ABC transporter substrate-binding protein [Nocardiopsis sp. LDBS1602]